MQILGTNLELWEGLGSVLLVNFSFISSWHILLERTSHMFSDCMDQWQQLQGLILWTCQCREHCGDRFELSSQFNLVTKMGWDYFNARDLNGGSGIDGTLWNGLIILSIVHVRRNPSCPTNSSWFRSSRKHSQISAGGSTICLVLGFLVLHWYEVCTALKQALIEFFPLLTSSTCKTKFKLTSVSVPQEVHDPAATFY